MTNCAGILPSEEIEKIDSRAALGLLGTVDSLAYRLGKIENHHHNKERWIGVAADADGAHKASEIGKAGEAGFTETPFTVTTGNDDWSDNPTQIIGVLETTIFDGAYFDLHRIMVVDSSVNEELFFMRISWGTGTAAASITAKQYTGFPLHVQKTDKVFAIQEIMMERVPTTGYKMWLHAFHANTNDTTIDMLLGIHEYVG